MAPDHLHDTLKNNPLLGHPWSYRYAIPDGIVSWQRVDFLSLALIGLRLPKILKDLKKQFRHGTKLSDCLYLTIIKSNTKFLFFFLSFYFLLVKIKYLYFLKFFVNLVDLVFKIYHFQFHVQCEQKLGNFHPVLVV